MKKGFTLIEILTVIIILAILFVIAVPQISKIINNSKTSIYKRNEEVLIKASELYTLRNQEYYPASIGDTTEITLEELQEVKYISDIINPENKNEECNGYVLVTKTKEDEYEYVPHIKCGLEINSSSEDNLVAHYKLNGNAFDYTLNNNHGVVYGAISITDRHENVNNALQFDGVDDYLKTSYSQSDITNTDHTIFFWIKAESVLTNDNNDRITPIKDSSSWSPGIWFHRSTIRGHTNGVYVDVSWNHDSNWHFIGQVYDSANNKLQIILDGIILDGVSTPYSASATGSLDFGADYLTGTRIHPMVIDDIRIYSRALSEEEIKLIYELEK